MVMSCDCWLQSSVCLKIKKKNVCIITTEKEINLLQKELSFECD